MLEYLIPWRCSTFQTCECLLINTRCPRFFYTRSKLLTSFKSNARLDNLIIQRNIVCIGHRLQIQIRMALFSRRHA